MSPSSEPAVLDLEHLDRVTQGDSMLAAEVLRLFSMQAHDLGASLPGAKAGAADAAHKLKGSARAIGAFAVERAVSAFEDALQRASAAGQSEAAAALESALVATESAIEAYCARHGTDQTAAGVGTFEPL